VLGIVQTIVFLEIEDIASLADWGVCAGIMLGLGVRGLN
jgi:hypothetical protein